MYGAKLCGTAGFTQPARAWLAIGTIPSPLTHLLAQDAWVRNSWAVLPSPVRRHGWRHLAERGEDDAHASPWLERLYTLSTGFW